MPSRVLATPVTQLQVEATARRARKASTRQHQETTCASHVLICVMRQTQKGRRVLCVRGGPNTLERRASIVLWVSTPTMTRIGNVLIASLDFTHLQREMQNAHLVARVRMASIARTARRPQGGARVWRVPRVNLEKSTSAA